MVYSINEIFYSIQGEGFHAGEPAVFIRFAGCNLKCPWCDTDHSVKMELNEDEIIASLLDYPRTMYVLTGGEPTLQDLRPFLEKIHAIENKISEQAPFICVESNGTFDGDSLFADCIMDKLISFITISPKPEQPPTDFALEVASEIKVVFDGIIDPAAYWSETLMESRKLFIQPCSEAFEPAVAYVKENPNWRLSIQTQKIIGVR